MSELNKNSKIYRVESDGYGISIPSYFTLHIGDILYVRVEKAQVWISGKGVSRRVYQPVEDFQHILYRIDYKMVGTDMSGIENVNIPYPRFDSLDGVKPLSNRYKALQVNLDGMLEDGKLSDITVAFNREKKLEDILSDSDLGMQPVGHYQ